MKFFEQLRQDFKQGENFDLYLTILITIILTVLNVINLVPQTLIASLNLPVLALLAFAILGNRHHIEKLIDKAKARDDALLTTFPDIQLYHDMDKAKELMLIGVDLTLVLKLNYARIERKLEKGDSLKVMLVNPDSAACEMAAMLHYEPMTADEKRNSIIRSLRLLEQLRQKTNGRVEIRTANYLPAIGAIITDLKTSDGTIYLWHYAFKAPDMSRLKLILHHRDGDWYDTFKEEVNAMWASGVISPL